MTVKPRLGLTTWLVFLVLGAVVPLFFFAGLILRGVIHTSQELVDRGQVDTTRALALAVDGEIRSWKAALAALAESRSIQPGRWAEFYEEAKQVGRQHDGWVVLTVSSGEQILNTLLPYGTTLHKTSSPETINAIFRDGKPLVSELIWGQNAQRHLVAVAVPVVRGGQVVNCLTLNFSPDRLNQLLLRQQLPASWVAAINDRERHVVARSRDAEARVGKPVVEWFAAATRASESGIVTGPLIDGRLGQIAFERLREAPWVVALAIPVAELQSAAPIWGFLAIGAILGVMAVGTAAYMGRKVTGPVRSLARASENLLRGETDDAIPPAGVRELQELQQALVKASAAARAHAWERERAAEALRTANEDLERRVTERTKALAHVNEALRAANADLQEEITQRLRAEENVRAIARFPSENPHPVLRLDSDGRILFANAASAPVLAQWDTTVGSLAPAPWPGAVGDALMTKTVATTEIRCGDRAFTVYVVPISEAGYVNLYMSDITDRKCVEAAVETALQSLEEERNLLQSVMTGATNCHLVCVDRDFNFVNVNEAYARTCGYAPEEMIGKNHFALYPDAENEATFTRVRDTAIPAEFHDKPFVFPDQPERGTTYWDWTLTPIVAESGYVTGLVFSLVETTHRKRVEMALETARAEAVNEKNRLEAVLQALPVGMALVDAQGATIRANAAFEQVWGGPRPPARTVADYVAYKAWWADSGRPLQPAEWASAQAVQQKRPVIGQFLQIERFDGTHAFVLNSAAPILDAGGEVIGAAVAIQDISDLRTAQEALRRSEALYRAIGESMDYGVWVCDRNGRNTYASDSFLKMVGLTQEQCSDFGWGAVLHPDDADRTIAAWKECVRTCGIWDIEHRFRGVDGQWHDVLARGVPVRDETGEVVCWAGINLDISRLKRAEEALRRLNSELEQRVAERTAELAQAVQVLERQTGQLRTVTTALTVAEQRERRRLADVLHDDLQQLLVATRLRAHMLGSGANAAVHKGAQEIIGLMEEALVATRTLTGELSPPGLQRGGLVPALEWLVGWTEEKHHLAVHFVPPPIPLPSLPEETAMLLYQAVRECLLNTVKHARASTAIVTVTAAESALTVTVADEGVGFDPARLRVAGGNEGGVGLLGIHERLEGIGGRLEISSTPGSGSRLALVAPLGRAAPAPAIPSPPVQAAPETGPCAAPRLRVLVVDDHALVRRGFAALLAGVADLEVVGEADNGQRAIELSRQLAPDVVLMDVNMPIMNGIDATRAIHAEFPAIRVIGLSIFEDHGQPEAIRSAGAVGCLSKNAGAEALLAAIRGVGAPGA